MKNGKITLATVKSFIRKNWANLHIKCTSDFDGMDDSIHHDPSAQFHPVKQDDRGCESNTLGIAGAWFVKGSRDYFSAYEDRLMVGIDVSNCCGSFILAVPK